MHGKAITPQGQLISAIVTIDSSSIPKHNYVAVVAPTVNDDSSHGYAKGSVWINTLTDAVYTCVDSSVGASHWAVSSQGVTGIMGINGIQGVTGVMGINGVTGVQGVRGERFEVDQYADLNEAKVTEIASSGATPENVYMLVVLNDTRSNKTTPINSSDLSRHCVMFDGSSWFDFGPFTGMKGENGITGIQGTTGVFDPSALNAKVSKSGDTITGDMEIGFNKFKNNANSQSANFVFVTEGLVLTYSNSVIYEKGVSIDSMTTSQFVALMRIFNPGLPALDSGINRINIIIDSSNGSYAVSLFPATNGTATIHSAIQTQITGGMGTNGTLTSIIWFNSSNAWMGMLVSHVEPEKHLKIDAGSLNVSNTKIINVATGINPGDASNVGQLAAKLSRSGDTMTGDLNIGTHHIKDSTSYSAMSFVPASVQRKVSMGTTFGNSGAISSFDPYGGVFYLNWDDYILSQSSTGNTLRISVGDPAKFVDVTVLSYIPVPFDPEFGPMPPGYLYISTDFATLAAAAGFTQYEIDTFSIQTYELFKMQTVAGSILTLSNDLDLGSNKILNVATGINPGDAVNFSQLQAIPAGVTGLRGFTGIGIQGQTGLMGLTGIQGQTGIRGVTGLIGAASSTAITPNVIDWNVDVSYASISANTTYTFSNNANGRTVVVVLTNTSGSQITITLPTVKKRSDFANTIAASSSCVFSFVQCNGIVYASSVTGLV